MMDNLMGNMVKNQMQGKLKGATKDVKFKSLYTWARVSGFICTLIVLGMVFQQFPIAPGCAILAVVAGCITFFVELICCFKCCNCTKVCATKIDAVISYGPFFKGALYLTIAIAGFVLYHFTMTLFVDPTTGIVVPKSDIGVIFDFILFAIPGIMYILAFIVTDKCQLRKPKDKKNSKESDIEEQFEEGVGPHEYQKKNLFSKTCKHCGEANAEACATKQEEEAAAKAAAADKGGDVIKKMKSGLSSFGEKMSAGFKDLGAKMKIGQKKEGNNAPRQSREMGSRPSSSRRSVTNVTKEEPEDDGEVNPFARRKSSPRKASPSVQEDNPFL